MKDQDINKSATDSTDLHGFIGRKICAIRETRGVLPGSYGQLFNFACMAAQRGLTMKAERKKARAFRVLEEGRYYLILAPDLGYGQNYHLNSEDGEMAEQDFNQK